LGEDVEERTAWGIDLYTACNLLAVLPREMPPSEQSRFIESRLMFAVQQQGANGYDIQTALNYIMNDT
jgi:hypothetical protein